MGLLECVLVIAVAFSMSVDEEEMNLVHVSCFKGNEEEKLGR